MSNTVRVAGQIKIKHLNLKTIKGFVDYSIARSGLACNLKETAVETEYTCTLREAEIYRGNCKVRLTNIETS
ncbi:MAG: Uncharacterised protein [Methanobacteriota archaeon]|nr:MAG: Uncharacterised protein [Euryarchaeota archaeon]